MLAGTASALSGCGEEKTNNDSGNKSDNATAANVAEGTILQVFSWDFNTIKECMPDIAAAGFSAVQTSPINECLEGEGGRMELYGDG